MAESKRPKPEPNATQKRPAPRPIDTSEPLGELLDRYKLPLLLVVAVLLFAGTRFEATRDYEAAVVALAFPVLAAFLAAGPLRDSHPALKWSGFLLAGLVLVACELSLGRAFFPPAPLSEAHLTPAEPDASLALPDRQQLVEVEIRGHLPQHAGGEGRYVVVLKRSDDSQRISGEFSRNSATATRRGAAAGTPSPHDVDRQVVTLRGSGPASAHLELTSGALGKEIGVALRPAAPSSLYLHWVLLGLGALGVVIEAWAARRGLRARYAAWMGIAVGLALYLPQHFSPTDEFSAVLAGLLIGMFAGGGAGLLLGELARRVVRPA